MLLNIICVGRAGDADVLIQDSRQKKLSIYFLKGHSFSTLGLLLRFLDLILHQEDPNMFSQQELRGLVDKTTAQQPKV